MLYFIGETGSRVSIISFVIAFLAGTILYKTKTNIAKIRILIGSAVVLILIGILLMQSEILVERIESSMNSGDLGSRDKIWKAIFPIFMGNPIFGIGKTGYELQSTFIIGKSISPHNAFLEILCYTGIIGLLIYLTFIFHVFKRGYNTYKNRGWLLPLLLISPILGLLLSSQILDIKIGWTIFAYIISSSAIPMKSLKNKEEKKLKNENSVCN
jgi:O-antigen ligase